MSTQDPVPNVPRSGDKWNCPQALCRTDDPVMAVLRAILIALLALAGLATPAALAGSEEPVVVTVFWGQGCPYCSEALEFLHGLEDEFPLEIVAYEVSRDPDSWEIFAQTMERFGLEPRSVPTTVIGDRVWVGFSEPIAAEIRSAVASSTAPDATPPSTTAESIDLPLIGTVDSGEVPLFVATGLIALVDGINPCSLWVLAILLALVLRTRSRRRVLAVGVTFLFITALLYAFYIAGMYGLLTYMTGEAWVRVTMALVALGFGVVSLKDFFKFGEGFSLGIAEDKKPGLYRRMRAISVEASTLPVALAGTALLAVGVSILETPCTAGYPLLWANLLAEQQIGLMGALPLFALYMTIFLADELAILGAAVVTMRATKLEERAGRVLRLVSGAVMVVLAATLILAPDAMTSITGSLAVFGVAIALCVVVLAAEALWKRLRRDPTVERR